MSTTQKTALLHRRGVRLGAGALLGSLLFLALLAGIQFILVKHPKTWDLTKSRRYTLSDQSRKILKSMKGKVNTLAFCTQENRREAEDLLRQYANQTGNFTYRVVDPVRNPALRKQFGIISSGTLVLEYTPPEMPTGKQGLQARKETLTAINEETVTNALARLTQEGAPRIYALTNHGEKSLDSGQDSMSTLAQTLRNQDYVINTLDLLRDKDVPADASLVLIAGPATDIAQSELEALGGYLDRGGKLLVMTGPERLPGLVKFLAARGVEVGDNFVVDPVSKMSGGDDLIPIALGTGAHPITQGLERLAFLFPLARTIDPAKQSVEGWVPTELVKTGATAWAESDVGILKRGGGKLVFNPRSDRRGPLNLAIAVIHPAASPDPSGKPAGPAAKSKEARLVVFGSSEFAANTFFVVLGNRNLVLNTIDWLAQRENLISIDRPPAENTPLILTSTQNRVVILLAMVLLPGVVILVGLVLYGRRG